MVTSFTGLVGHDGLVGHVLLAPTRVVLGSRPAKGLVLLSNQFSWPRSGSSAVEMERTGSRSGAGSKPTEDRGEIIEKPQKGINSVLKKSDDTGDTGRSFPKG